MKCVIIVLESGEDNPLPPPDDQNDMDGDRENDEGPDRERHRSPDSEAYGEQPDDVKAENEFLMQYMSLPSHIREMIGHSFDGFIKECTFRGRTCLNTT